MNGSGSPLRVLRTEQGYTKCCFQRFQARQRSDNFCSFPQEGGGSNSTLVSRSAGCEKAESYFVRFARRDASPSQSTGVVFSLSITAWSLHEWGERLWPGIQTCRDMCERKERNSLAPKDGVDILVPSFHSRKTLLPASHKASGFLLVPPSTPVTP